MQCLSEHLILKKWKTGPFLSTSSKILCLVHRMLFYTGEHTTKCGNLECNSFLWGAKDEIFTTVQTWVFILSSPHPPIVVIMWTYRGESKYSVALCKTNLFDTYINNSLAQIQLLTGLVSRSLDRFHLPKSIIEVVAVFYSNTFVYFGSGNNQLNK